MKARTMSTLTEIGSASGIVTTNDIDCSPDQLKNVRSSWFHHISNETNLAPRTHFADPPLYLPYTPNSCGCGSSGVRHRRG